MASTMTGKFLAVQQLSILSSLTQARAIHWKELTKITSSLLLPWLFQTVGIGYSGQLYFSRHNRIASQGTAADSNCVFFSDQCISMYNCILFFSHQVFLSDRADIDSTRSRYPDIILGNRRTIQGIFEYNGVILRLHFLNFNNTVKINMKIQITE